MKRQELRLALPPPAGPAAPPAQQAVTATPTSTTAAAATGVVPAVPAGTAVAPAPAAGIATEPIKQPVPVAVIHVKLKKDTKRADRFGSDDSEPGSSREIETEIITQSLFLSELRDMQKDFSHHQARTLSPGCCSAGVMGPAV